jgi:hypothetical protein
VIGPTALQAIRDTPIPVENAAVRAEYVRCQKAIAIRAEPLRAALLGSCDLVPEVAGYQ